MNRLFYLSLIFIMATLLPFSTFGQEFLNGEIINNDGTILSGEIKLKRASFSIFGSGQSSIVLKQAGNKQSYKPNMVKGFRYGSKEFTIVKNFKIHSIGGEFEEDFAEILLEGRINLFMHYASSSDGQSFYKFDRFIVSDSQKKNCIGVYKMKKQRKDISKLFDKDSEMQSYIINAKWKEIDLYQLVKEYNAKYPLEEKGSMTYKPL